MKLNKYTRQLFLVIALIGTGYMTEPVAAAKNNINLINSFEKDITGDGIEEYIKLEGTLLSEKSSFYQNVWLDIKGPFKNSWTISLQNGYLPELSFINFNDEQASSIFYKVAKDSEAAKHHYQVYTLQNNRIQLMDLPSDLHIQADLKDNFLLELTVSPIRKPIIVDLKHRKKQYIDQSVYDREGKIINKSIPVIKSISKIEPFKISGSETYGLKTVQDIIIANTDITIGALETKWHYADKKWQNQKTVFKQND